MSSFAFESATLNINDGYVEGLLRSLRKGILDENVYNNLKTATNINDFKQLIEETDYGTDIFAQASEASDFEVTALRKAMRERLMSEFDFLKAQAVYPLNHFLSMMLHGYQIDNVVFIIEGLKSGRNLEELLKTADPLGRFPELKNIQPIEGDDYASLYQNVLIDLPIGQYFRKFLDEVTAAASADEGTEIDTKFISEAMADYSLQQI